MILLTGAFIMLLHPAVESVAAVLRAHAEYRDVVERLLFRPQFLDLALFDEIARDAHDVVVLKIAGEVAQAVRERALDDREDRLGGLEPGFFKFENIARAGGEIGVELLVDLQLLEHRRLHADGDARAGRVIHTVRIDTYLGVQAVAMAVGVAVGRLVGGHARVDRIHDF